MPVGTESPLRNVNFQGGQLGKPGERRKIIDHRIVIVVIFMGDGAARHPIRRARSQILVEEDGRRFSFPRQHRRQRLRVAGRSRRCGSMANLRVIGQNISLGGLGLGIEHLVKVAELDRPALNGHHLVARCPAHAASIDVSLEAQTPSQSDSDEPEWVVGGI